MEKELEMKKQERVKYKKIEIRLPITAFRFIGASPLDPLNFSFLYHVSSFFLYLFSCSSTSISFAHFSLGFLTFLHYRFSPNLCVFQFSKNEQDWFAVDFLLSFFYDSELFFCLTMWKKYIIFHQKFTINNILQSEYAEQSLLTTILISQ